MVIKVISRIILIVFFFLIITNFISGINSSPVEGDSLNYHIPIARNILNGNIVSQTNVVNIERWYPGSSEIILAIFILLNIPLNLFNVFSIFIFFIVLYKFGQMFLGSKDLSLIFSSSVTSSYGVLRLIHTQNIDIWMVIYFLILIIFLEKPQNKLSYFLGLGFFSGMLVGSKYIGPFFFLVLLIVYFKTYMRNINSKKILLFLIPFIIFGASWYIRNLILTGSPVYPQSILFFEGLESWNSIGYMSTQTWMSFLRYPDKMFDAYISEFMIWPIIFFVVPLFVILRKKNNVKYKSWQKFKKLLFIITFTFIFYLIFPSSDRYLAMVLTMRYIYNVFVLSVLLIFLVAHFFKKEIIVVLIALTNIIIILFPSYHPKLLFIFIPLVFFIGLFMFYCNQLVRKMTK